MVNITSGVLARPQKVVIYGAEGVGKTTLASKFPNPVFIDTEVGTSHLDVQRVSAPRNWDELIAIINELSVLSSMCKTVVIDTADWAEIKCAESVCAKYKKTSIEEFGYGKGVTYLGEEFAKLIKACDGCIANGINVVINAHAKMRKFEQPDEMGAYDRWELKLSKNASAMLKEWADLLLFLTYETTTVKSADNKVKAVGNKRVMYTSHHACWDAKNRHGLPDKLDLDYKFIEPIFAATAPAPLPTPQTTTQQRTPLQIKLEQNLKRYGVNYTVFQRVCTAHWDDLENLPVDEYNDAQIQRIVDNFKNIMEECKK